MNYAETLAKLRKDCKYTQDDVAAYLSEHSDKTFTNKAVSHWEKGIASPSVEQFLLLCELYGVRDIQETFRNIKAGYRGESKLNALGKSRVEEYISMLSTNTLFSEPVIEDNESSRRYIKLYDIPVAAGYGAILDSDAYEDFEVDKTVPGDADFAVRVSGDSMTPRFVDGQIVFIKQQQSLDVGEIGIFELAGDAYIKKLGRAELISLNTQYEPIPVREYDSFHVFGIVVG
jgi:SOS-response transcriptional repressor LexA